MRQKLGILFYLFEESSPATASNLEQGKILKEVSFFEGGVKVHYGFKESAKVFWEYLRRVKQKRGWRVLFPSFLKFLFRE